MWLLLVGVLDAVPMDESLHSLFPDTKIVLDTTALGWTSPEDAVKYCAEPSILNQTTTLAMQVLSCVAISFCEPPDSFSYSFSFSVSVSFYSCVCIRVLARA